MPLGNPTNGRITGHLGNQVEVHGVERRAQSHSGGSHGGFATGVTGTNHHHIVLFVILGGADCHVSHPLNLLANTKG